MFSGHHDNSQPLQASSLIPSTIRTIPSAPEFHRVMCFDHFWCQHSRALTAGRELHPAPKVIQLLRGLYTPQNHSSIDVCHAKYGHAIVLGLTHLKRIGLGIQPFFAELRKSLDYYSQAISSGSGSSASAQRRSNSARYWAATSAFVTISTFSSLLSSALLEKFSEPVTTICSSMMKTL